MSSYEYYLNDVGDDHAQPPDTNNNYAAHDNSDNKKSLPQHHGLLQTPHGAMTEILATTGSSVLPPSQLQRQSPTTQQTNNNRPEAAVVKKSLRIKAAKHFHTRAVVGNDGNNNISSSSRDPDGMVLVNPYSSLSSSPPPKEIEAPSKVAAIRSSNKKYPQQHNDNGDTSMSTTDIHTTSNENVSYNSIAKHNNNAVTSIQPPSSIASRNYYNNNNNVIADDPAIEIYDDSAPSSDIGSGYNSGSDLENAARKILRRSRAAAAAGGGGGTSHRRSRNNNNGGYNSDCSLSDTGSAISSTTSSSAIRKLPEGWKERIKRKAMSGGGNNSKMNGVKLPPTMDKEKTKAEKLKLRQQQQQQQQQVEEQQQHYQHKEPEEMPIEDERDDGDPYYDNYNAITGGRGGGGGTYNDESDDDEYFQDHFNGSAGAFPSFSNDYDNNNNNYHVKHDDFIDEQQQQPQYYDDAVNPQSSSSSYFIDHPPIIEQHVFGPILPSTIYESNDEYEDEEEDDDKEHRRRKKDGPLFQNDWNPNAFITNTSSSSPSSSSPTRKKNGNDFVPIEEIDESGFPSPSRRKATSNVGESGFPSPSRKTNAAQEVDESSSFPSPSGKTNSIPQAVDESGFPSASPKSKLLQDQSEQMATIDGSIDSLHNEFNKDDYFHDFSSSNVDDWVPPSGVQWKSSTKRGTVAAVAAAPPRPPVVTDDILATFSGDKEDDDNNDLPNVSTWSESPFRDDFGVFAIEEEKKEGNEEGSQQRIVVKLPPLHQQSKTKDKASPAMNPFSTEDLTDVENPDAAGNATDATTTSPSRKGLNFFKRKGKGKGRLYHSEGEKTDSEYDTDASKKSARLKALSPLRRKNNKKKTAKKTEFVTKKSETRRNLFGGPTRVEKKSSPTNAKNTPSAQNPRWFENKVVATTPVVKLKGTPRDTATPIVSNIKSTGDTKPFASVKVYEVDDAADDGTVSTLGSIVTKESSLNIKAKLMSSNASANTAVSEIQRLRQENDKLRQELEKQTIESIRNENERLRQQLLERKVANAAAASPHRTRSFADSLISGESRTVGDSTLRTVGDSAYDGSLLRVKRNARDGMHKSTLSSLLKSDVKVNSRRSPRHHRITVTKNNLMNQADFDDDSVTLDTYSQRKPNQRYEFRKEFTGPSLACATEWMATQARNAAEGKGPRAMDCFTACSRKDRGQRRRRRQTRGTHDSNDSDTDDSITDMGDDSLRRDSVRPKPRPPIARKRAPNRFEERLL